MRYFFLSEIRVIEFPFDLLVSHYFGHLKTEAHCKIIRDDKKYRKKERKTQLPNEDRERTETEVLMIWMRKIGKEGEHKQTK